jgi:hypothetical protein
MDAEFHAGARRDHDRGNGADGAANGERTRLPSEARLARGTAAGFSLNGTSREVMPVGARDSCSDQHASRASGSPPATGLPSRQDSLLPEWERPARSSDTRQGPQKMIDAMTASTAELRAFLSNGTASSSATSFGADAAGGGLGGLGTAGAGMSGSDPDVNLSQTPARMPPRSWSSPSEDRGTVARAEQGMSVGVSVREADGLYWQNVRGKEDVGAGRGDGKRASEESADDESGKHQQDPVMCLRAPLESAQQAPRSFSLHTPPPYHQAASVSTKFVCRFLRLRLSLSLFLSLSPPPPPSLSLSLSVSHSRSHSPSPSPSLARPRSLALSHKVEALLKARESRERKISEIKSLLVNLKT